MRALRHLFSRTAGSMFPPALLSRLADAIAEGERRHTGQVMFAVESDLPWASLWRGETSRERAEHTFALLRTWDTEANNGVLIYLLLADHAIEIVADRGLADKVEAAQWEQICEQLRVGLRQGEVETAMLDALANVADLLSTHYPAGDGRQAHNELPDMPRVLD